jgi:copper(I)-binding protein
VPDNKRSAAFYIRRPAMAPMTTVTRAGRSATAEEEVPVAYQYVLHNSFKAQQFVLKVSWPTADSPALEAPAFPAML